MRPREVRVIRRMRQVRVRVCRHRERIALVVHLHFRSEATTHYLEHWIAIHLPCVASHTRLTTIFDNSAGSFLHFYYLLSHDAADNLLLPLYRIVLVRSSEISDSFDQFLYRIKIARTERNYVSI